MTDLLSRNELIMFKVFFYFLSSGIDATMAVEFNRLTEKVKALQGPSVFSWSIGTCMFWKIFKNTFKTLTQLEYVSVMNKKIQYMLDCNIGQFLKDYPL